MQHSQVVTSVLEQKTRLHLSNKYAYWAVANSCLALILMYDILHGELCSSIISRYPSLWYFEVCVTALFVLSAVYDILYYVWSSFNNLTITLAPTQSKLMGVRNSDAGFRSQPITPASPSSPPTPSLNLSSFLLPSELSTPNSSLLSPTPINYSGTSWHSSPTSRHSSPLNNSNLSTTASSWAYNDASFDPFTPNRHVGMMSSNSASPATNSGRSLRLRNLRTSPINELSSAMVDESVLAQYLQNDADREARQQSLMSEHPSTMGTLFWGSRGGLADYTPLFSKYPYQVALRPTQSPSRSDDLDSPTSYSVNEHYLKMGIRPELLYKWTERLRQWLSQTVLARLIIEIDALNAELHRLGSPDIQIGAVSLTALRQAALTKAVQLPSLPALLPYLEVTPNQEYLVHRLKDLYKGGSLGDFRWNSGGLLKGKPWGDHLPTDTTILMHLFCVYLDSRLPPHPGIPDGRTFTSQHVINTPDKPDMTNSETLCIYQTKLNPPHYRVIAGEDVHNIPEGRNNFFHAILLFLHHIKTKESGMLGRINLGLSGVNVLWILDD